MLAGLLIKPPTLQPLVLSFSLYVESWNVREPTREKKFIISLVSNQPQRFSAVPSPRSFSRTHARIRRPPARPTSLLRGSQQSVRLERHNVKKRRTKWWRTYRRRQVQWRDSTVDGSTVGTRRDRHRVLERSGFEGTIPVSAAAATTTARKRKKTKK